MTMMKITLWLLITITMLKTMITASTMMKKRERKMGFKEKEDKKR